MAMITQIEINKPFFELAKISENKKTKKINKLIKNNTIKNECFGSK